MKSWKTPTPDQVSKAVALLGHAEQYRYFFDRLENPLWIQPLREHKFFQAPAAIIHDEERGTVSFPPWPESRYLARVAPFASTDVQLIILEILLSVETNNISVHEDLVQAATGLPGDCSAAFAAKEASWIKTQSHIFGLLPEKLGKLIEHLGEQRQIEAALNLSYSLFEVLPHPKSPKEDDDNNRWTWKPDPVSRLEKWDYAIISKKLLNLSPHAGHQILDMFSDLLEIAISLSQRRTEQTGPEDYSYIWRRGIEHSHNNDSIKEILVSRVRDAAEKIASLDPTQVPEIVERLENRRWLIFKRIALHVLKTYPQSAESLVVARILNKANFDERGLWHEYIGLVRDHFGKLTTAQKDQFLNWIETEKTRESVKELQQRWDGTILSDEEADRQIKQWKVRRLKPIYDVISDEWRKRVDEWERETGTPDGADYVTPAPQIRFGLESPKTREELHGMSVEEIVAFLQRWRRSDDNPIAPSPEGLGRELSARIAADPTQFAAEAERFIGLESTYVRHLLSSLREATKQGTRFSWHTVLRLCLWVVNQPNELAAKSETYLEQDVGWTDTRATIAELLSAGLETGANEIPSEVRAQVRDILLILVEDPDPDPERDHHWRTSDAEDALTLSINSTRGEALHAVVRYALWVHRQRSTSTDEGTQEVSSFDLMPEVREVLDRHLDPVIDPSPAIRAVYGSWLPWLISIDASWVSSNLERIFPPDENLRELRDAAWNTYIVYNDAYNNILSKLKDEYLAAINRLGDERSHSRRHVEKPDERLSEHLMLFYGRGISPSEEMVAEFYAKATDGLCAHAGWFVGESLSEDVPRDVLTRFQSLWDQRLKIAHDSPAAHKQEVISFGSLFSAKRFDEAWAIMQLKNSLQISHWSEPDHKVVEYLAELSNRFTREAVECLAIMVEGDKDGWHVQFWGENVRTILTAALRSTDMATHQFGQSLVHRLGARGHWQFRDLLQDAP